MPELFGKWVKEFVSQPHPSLKGWPPCPFARQALLDDKVVLVPSDGRSLFNDVAFTVEKELDKDKDLIVFYFDQFTITPDALRDLTLQLNGWLKKYDRVLLEDHPESEEKIGDCVMNFGHCGLLFMQKASALKAASEELFAKGYYDSWPHHQLDDVVNWRS